MVLDPLLISHERTYHFSRVLVDGGKSLNLLYHASMKKLGIPERDFHPSSTMFHGVAPGPPVCPVGESPAVCHIRLRELLARANLVRDGEPSQHVPCSSWAPRPCKVHGGPPLCIPKY